MTMKKLKHFWFHDTWICIIVLLLAAFKDAVCKTFTLKNEKID